MPQAICDHRAALQYKLFACGHVNSGLRHASTWLCNTYMGFKNDAIVALNRGYKIVM